MKDGSGVSMREVRVLLALAAPNVLTQVLSMGLNVADTVMLGHVGAEAVAASALGGVWVHGTLIVAMGVILGIDPLVSRAHGARDGERAGLALQRGLVIALGLSALLAVLWLYTEPILLRLGQDPALVREASRYVLVQIPGIPGFLAFSALRQYLQGRGIAAPAAWVMLAANLFNIFGNWVLIYGNLGAPAMGLVGAGISTTLGRLGSAALLAAMIFGLGLHRGYWVPWSRAVLRWSGIATILALGLPIGLQIGLEVWAFEIATLFAGRLGTVPLAAHSIVLSMASLSFMMALGTSIASATRVGNMLGSGDIAGVRGTARTALALGGLVMLSSAAAFVVLRRWLPSLYAPDDAAVIALCASVLPVAAAFQVFDGLQAVSNGVLRGLGRTQAPAVINVVAWYVVAIPLGWWLGFRAERGLAGIWLGLAAGLLCAAGLLVWRVEHGIRELARRPAGAPPSA